ncbi:pentatricopeptide repeat-containing protein 1, mitochondrial-like [Pecten maximus]|uniref:pentatricopeptide repeat-containing protein 1, mitochondrial-like n=1 Tax=Pecten maximus TaxID=6579 RepID=UPI0014580DA5|nr:pentatricopeptide repeat-containing protein 1, mitochondrial-like [Pecten maximus]
MKTMQRLVLRSHLMRGISFSIKCNNFDRCLPTSGADNMFQCRTSYALSSGGYRARSDRRSDKQMSFLKISSTYVTGQNDEPDYDRKSLHRKTDVSYKHNEDKVDDDTSPWREKSDPYHLYGAHNTKNDQEEISKSSLQDDDVSKSSLQGDEWGDTFGNLSRDLNMDPNWLQDGNFDKPLEFEKPHRRLSVEDRRHPQEWYFDQIVAMGKEGKVLKAISVLDDWMLVRDRVMPNEDIFTAVIGIIGRTGNASLAFKYFKKMRDYGLRPNDATFTALFNACSNCPDKKTALKKGNSLRNYMQRSEIIPNIVTYNAIIKMYGRLGDLPNAFLIADEAMSNRRAADAFFFGSLLSAAISDKEEGLLFAIEIWRKMMVMRVQPDVFHYRLMLHTIKDCKLGSEEQQQILLQPYVSHKKLQAKQKQTAAMTEVATQYNSTEHPINKHSCDTDREEVQPQKSEIAKQMKIKTSEMTTHQQTSLQHECPPKRYYGDLEQIQPQKSHRPLKQKNKQGRESQLELHTGQCSDDTSLSHAPQPSVAMVQSHEKPCTVATFPDLLNPKETFSEVVSLGNMSESRDRLMLMGGVRGFLHRMKADKVSPDITVLTWLVEMIRGKEDEEIILSALAEGNIKADSTFLNALIRSKSHRETYSDAKAVLQLFSKYDVVPNKQTYGSLIFCTRDPKDAKEILESMENAGLVPDIKTFGLLIGKAPGAFQYKKRLLRKMENLNIKPDMHFLGTIERHLQNIRTQILVEKRKNRTNKSKALEEDLDDFNEFYKEWLLKTKMAKKPHQLENYRKKKTLTSSNGLMSTTA